MQDLAAPPAATCHVLVASLSTCFACTSRTVRSSSSSATCLLERARAVVTPRDVKFCSHSNIQHLIDAMCKHVSGYARLDCRAPVGRCKTRKTRRSNAKSSLLATNERSPACPAPHLDISFVGRAFLLLGCHGDAGASTNFGGAAFCAFESKNVSIPALSSACVGLLLMC